MKKRTKKFQIGGMADNQEITVPDQSQPTQAPNTTPNYWYNQSENGNQNLQSSMQNLGITGYKKGGKVGGYRKSADGCAKRGKTRGRIS